MVGGGGHSLPIIDIPHSMPQREKGKVNTHSPYMSETKTKPNPFPFLGSVYVTKDIILKNPHHHEECWMLYLYVFMNTLSLHTHVAGLASCGAFYVYTTDMCKLCYVIP
jgi:hypothetical protein